MFIEGRTFSMSETAIQQIEYFDDCQGTDSYSKMNFKGRALSLTNPETLKYHRMNLS